MGCTMILHYAVCNACTMHMIMRKFSVHIHHKLCNFHTMHVHKTVIVLRIHHVGTPLRTKLQSNIVQHVGFTQSSISQISVRSRIFNYTYFLLIKPGVKPSYLFHDHNLLI